MDITQLTAITTTDEYDAATTEWEACERFLGEDNTQDENDRALARQIRIEELIDACPFSYDDEGRIVRKDGR